MSANKGTWNCAIDIGGFHSVVCSSSAEDPHNVSVVVNAVSNRSTPSVVGLDNRQILVGEQAEARQISNLKGIVGSLLDCLRSHDEAFQLQTLQGWSWNIEEQNGQVLLGPLDFNGESIHVSPRVILAIYLQRLFHFAKSQTDLSKGEPPNITLVVGDHWPEDVCCSIHLAAKLAFSSALNVNLLRASSAVMIAYTHQQKEKISEAADKFHTIFVDMGYGHFTATVATFKKKDESENNETEFERCQADVLAVKSDANLGVNKFLQALRQQVCTAFEVQGHKIEAGSKPDIRLQRALVNILKELSLGPVSELLLECFFPGDDVDLVQEFSREKLEHACQGQLCAIRELIVSTLHDAGIKSQDVDYIEVIGGGTRIPMVQKVIRDTLSSDAKSPDDLNLGRGLDGSSCLAVGGVLHSAGARFSTSPIVRDGDVAVVCPQEDLHLKSLTAVSDLEVSRLKCKNDLESFIYDMKDRLNGKQSALMQPEIVKPYLDEMSMWMDDAEMNDVPVDAYENKLSEARAFCKDK